MITLEIDNFEIDYCEKGCKGVWFDAFEMKRTEKKPEHAENAFNHIFEDTQEKETHINREKRAVPILCPVCNVKMKERPYKIKSDILIDFCYKCGGIWLDGGELKEIFNNLDEINKKSEKFKNQRLHNTGQVYVAGGSQFHGMSIWHKDDPILKIGKKLSQL
jgi:Zn-finger nucleic acid-binding protein